MSAAPSPSEVLGLDDSPKAKPEYDRWQRYKIPHPNNPTGPGASWTRATTVAKAISDQTALNSWMLRKVAEGAAKYPHMLTDVDWEDKKAADALAQNLLNVSGARDGATRGSHFHTLTEQLDRGEEIQYGDDLDRLMVEGYKAACTKLNIGAVPAFIERTVVVPGLDKGGAQVAGIAGTFDRVMQSKRSGKFYVWDFKTHEGKYGPEYSMPEWEIQLAIYSQARVFWDWESRQFYDLPNLEQDRALVFHVNRNTAEWTVYPVDLQAGRASLDLALGVRAWRTRNRTLHSVPAATSDD